MNRKIVKSDIYDSALKGIYHQGYKATTMRAIASEIGIEAATLYKEFLAHRKRYEKILEKLLQQAIQCGDLRDADLDILKNCILSTVRWLFSWVPKNKEKMNPVELEKQIIELILNGISK